MNIYPQLLILFSSAFSTLCAEAQSSASMQGRAVSPAGSENALDITNALLSAGELTSNDNAHRKAVRPAKHLAATKSTADDDELSSDEDFIASIQTAANRKASNIKGRSVKKGGGFQAMGLNGNLLKAIAHKGYSVPTPIQRKTIPLVLAGQDVVGMARTGSGKTAAFVLPMLERLKQHQLQFGARALIMSPSRELALQTLKVIKEFGKNTNLRCTLIVGGDKLEDQFQAMKEEFPDIVVATPGRFLHVKVEMDLDLSSYEYVVFDEADRLFEMGFATQLNEILHGLASSRQTLLFSATLPTSLVEFAKAGLQDPRLIRLDSESKVSPDLQNAFFTVKSAEKEAALLHILQDVIKMPTGETKAANAVKVSDAQAGKKRKRSEMMSNPTESPTEHSTIVFTATKHHVEYVAQLLKASGYAVSYVYGSLDQTARKIQVQNFRTGMSNILIVTDVAARGIDIPVLANVINYDFPAQPKIFVHRVGRTARAGQRGWSYSLVKESDCPYLLDLQLFLAKRLVFGQSEGEKVDYTDDVIVGSLSREKVSGFSEWINKLLDENSDIAALRSVAMKGEKLYQRTRSSASAESARRAKEIISKEGWTALHSLFKNDIDNIEIAREAMLSRISDFRPQETVFELGNKGIQVEAATVVKKQRLAMERKRLKSKTSPEQSQLKENNKNQGGVEIPEQSDDEESNPNQENADEAFEDDNLSTSSLEVTITDPASKPSHYKSTTTSTLPSNEYHMSYVPTGTNASETRGYSINGTDAASFITAANSATMNLTNDESTSFNQASKPSLLKWDKRHKKYVSQSTQDDEKSGGNRKTIRSESGAKIAASFRSGRFEAWKQANRIDRLPRVGEEEKSRSGSSAGASRGGRHFKHTQIKAPKEADRFRDDYHVRKKRITEAKDKRIGRFSEGAGKAEVKDLHTVQKERLAKARRKEKTGRHRGSAVTARGGRGRAERGGKGGKSSRSR